MVQLEYFNWIQLYQQYTNNRNHLNMKYADTPKITVAIRKRPLNRKEIQRSETDIVRVGSGGQVVVCEHKQKVDLTKYIEETTFNFDYAYDENSNNEEIYQQSIRPLIENAFMGAKISCFAYGQTGSGKTHTMKGDMSKNIPGLYYLGAREIFRYLEQSQFKHLHVTVSFYQIYCGRLYDLLNNRAELKIREDKKQNINVIGMEEKLICSANQFLDIIEYGSNFRVTSQNATNADSSRSHAILQITLKNQKKVFTKISFIDLAGNERGADHIDQNKQTKIDGAEINKSLLSLKECIRALDQGKGHTPFRGSKLTMVLKDSFVGFCNTVMICNVSPNSSSSENTMNTLRYADRVKELKSSQSQNLTKQQIMARELMLPRANNKNCIKVNIDNNDDEDDILLKMEEARQYGPTKNKFQEKMDIEQPYDNKKHYSGISAGRNLTNQMKLMNMAEKRQANKSNKLQTPLQNFKGRDLAQQNQCKQPLVSRNVRHNQIDQNNLNLENNPHDFDMTKRQANRINGRNISNSVQLNRNHFEAMSCLRRDFEGYREDHQGLIREQMTILKEQMSLKQQYQRNHSISNNYEEEITDVNLYLDRMELCIKEKMDLFNQMKKNIEKMRASAKNAENYTIKIRQEQHEQTQRQPNMFFNNHQINTSQSLSNLGGRGQGRIQLHSSSNLHFNDYNNYNHHQFGDEQLLQGLPGDESMARLF